VRLGLDFFVGAALVANNGGLALSCRQQFLRGTELLWHWESLGGDYHDVAPDFVAKSDVVACAKTEV